MGTLLGGRIADRYGCVDYRHWVGVPALVSLLVIPIFISFLNTGMGYGPAEGLRWALIISACAGVVSFVCFWLARRTIGEDLIS